MCLFSKYPTLARWTAGLSVRCIPDYAAFFPLLMKQLSQAAQIITIITGLYGATDARLNFNFIRSQRSQKCGKQTRRHGLLLLFISLILALFSVTTEKSPSWHRRAQKATFRANVRTAAGFFFLFLFFGDDKENSFYVSFCPF